MFYLIWLLKYSKLWSYLVSCLKFIKTWPEKKKLECQNYFQKLDLIWIGKQLLTQPYFIVRWVFSLKLLSLNFVIENGSDENMHAACQCEWVSYESRLCTYPWLGQLHQTVCDVKRTIVSSTWNRQWNVSEHTKSIILSANKTPSLSAKTRVKYFLLTNTSNKL